MEKSRLQHPGLSRFRLANASRYMLLICVFAMLLFGLCACVSLEKSAYPAEIKADTVLRMTVGQTEYSSKVNRIEFTITNDSDDDAMFGAAYALEVFQDGFWYNVPLKGVKGDAQPTWPASRPRSATVTSSTGLDLAAMIPLNEG